MNELRVLIASNRLPVTAIKQAGGIRLGRSSGGLAAGLRHIEQNWRVRWYGWSGITNQARAPEELSVRAGASLIAIPLNELEVDRYYRHYCNGLLWPALHGMFENVACPSDSWQEYVAVNRRFAHALLNDMRPGDRVWIHDYHLLLMPEMLRHGAGQLDNQIAFFLHTPFPRAEEFARIEGHKSLIEGMLHSDVIGFHTDEYASNFREAACMIGCDVRGDSIVMGSRSTRLTVRPMGLDTETFGRLGADPAILDNVKTLRSTHRRILLGVDRLDYTKGIPQRLLAFETLLENRPELRGEVSLMQIAVPTREDSPGYDELKNVVESIVERVNRNYGTSQWLPIEYLYDTVDLNTLAALYRAADVMLVTPSRDGLNLVAKEFVATRVDGDGVLVLSKFAGVAKELTSAVFVDPHRIGELAETFYRAITMAMPERRRRMKQMMQSVSGNGINAWVRYFVDEPPQPPLLA